MDIPAEPTPVPPSDALAAKEPNSAIYTIIAVLVIALSAGGFYLAKQQAPVSPQRVSEIKNTPLFLTVASPDGQTTAVNNEVLVTGKTLPGTPVIIYSDTDDAIVESNADGSFEGSVLIPDGGGLLRLTAVGPDGGEISQTIQLDGGKSLSDAGGSDVLGKTTAPGQMKKTQPEAGVAMPQVEVTTNPGKPSDTPKATRTPKPTDTPNSGQSRTDVKTFLAKKVPSQKPDKLGADKIKSLLETESSGSGKLTGKLRKMEVKPASAAAELKRHAVQGVITAIDGGTITLAHQIERDRVTTVYFNIDTEITSKDGASGSGLVVGVRIAAVGIPADGSILAKRIHIIPGKASGIFNRIPDASEGGSTVTPTPVSTASGTPSPTQ